MDYQIVPSICPYCGVGCGVLLEVMDGKLVGTLPLKTHPSNEGKLCIKGWNLHEHVISSNRLLSPLVKEEGRFRETTWDEAIEVSANKLKAIVEEFGPDSVGVLTSAKMTNEANYLIQKFSRVTIGTNNVDHCARL